MIILDTLITLFVIAFFGIILHGANLLYADKQKSWELKNRCENSRYKFGKKY